MFKKMITLICAIALLTPVLASAEYAPQFQKSSTDKTDLSAAAPKHGVVYKDETVMENNVNKNEDVMENNVNKNEDVMESNINKQGEVMERVVSKNKNVMEN